MSFDAAPHAPWPLAGEAIVGLARWRGPSAPLPAGLSRIPGPYLVTATRYTDSPVGPFLELVVAAPARLGARPGWCVVTAAVDSPHARAGGVLNWGFPVEEADLRWYADGKARELVWAGREVSVWGRPAGPPLPWLVPVRALQRRGDGPVVVPGHQKGRAHFARVSVHAFPGDPLGPLAGGHPGVVVTGLRVMLLPARTPVGLTATLTAPLRAAEPAMWPSEAAVESLPSRAYSSVG